MTRRFPGLRDRLRGPAHWRRFVIAYCLALLVAYGLAAFQNVPEGFLLSGPGDFTSFYTAGTIICRGQGGDLYNLSLQAEVQQDILTPYELRPRKDVLPYANFPVYAVPFALFCRLPLHQAVGIWNAVNLAVLLFCIAVLWRSLDIGQTVGFGLASLLSLSFLFVYPAFWQGQVSFWLLLAFTVVFLALKNQHEEIAGMALAFVWLKPQLLFLFALVWVIRGRWRAFLTFALTTTLLFLVSLGLVGWNGLKAYAELLGRAGGWNGMPGIYPAAMPNLRGSAYRLSGLLGPGVPIALLQGITLLATLALVLWALRQWRGPWNPKSPEFVLLLAITLSIALLISPHLYMHDLTLLILVGFVAWDYAVLRNRTPWASRWIGLVHVGVLCAVVTTGTMLAAQAVAVLLLILAWALARELRSVHRTIPP